MGQKSVKKVKGKEEDKKIEPAKVTRRLCNTWNTSLVEDNVTGSLRMKNKLVIQRVHYILSKSIYLVLRLKCILKSKTESKISLQQARSKHVASTQQARSKQAHNKHIVNTHPVFFTFWGHWNK